MTTSNNEFVFDDDISSLKQETIQIRMQSVNTNNYVLTNESFLEHDTSENENAS